MSSTIVDMPKVTQMLDAGWRLDVYKGEMGSYVVEAKHDKPHVFHSAVQRLYDMLPKRDPMGDVMRDVIHDDAADGAIVTDDFTPEQALTRAAYKVMGDILGSEADGE